MSAPEITFETVLERAVDAMSGTAMALAMLLSDELGLYGAMRDAGPLTADAVSTRIGCNRRLVRELLDAQAAGGFLAYREDEDTYELTSDAAMVLADESSPAFLPRGMNVFASLFADVDKLIAAFRSASGGLSWGDHHERLFVGTEWLFRPGYRTFLTTMWIPALDGLTERLDDGITVADVGCGHGASTIVMAERWPNSTFVGSDFHGGSIDAATKEAARRGLTNVRFEVADAKGFDGTYDLICFFDCLHDMGDPVGIAAHARERLASGGTVMLVEPFAMAERTANLRENPMAAISYLSSALVCTPNSLSQEVGLGLGAQAGPEKMREVFADAGFSHFRVALESPVNTVLEARV